MTTKKCPFCAEEIQHEAIVCKHCGRDLPRTARAPVAELATKAPPQPQPFLTGSLPVDAPTLNPLRLWAECLRWRGRFSRLQFAIAYLGAMIVAAVAALSAGFISAALGVGAETLDAVLNVATGLIVLALLPLTIGAAVRRLHDLAWSGWLVLLAFVPCVNLGMVAFLLFAPGRHIRARGAGPDRTTAWPVVVFVAFLLSGPLAFLLLALLVVFTQGTAIAPFLYTLF